MKGEFKYRLTLMAIDFATNSTQANNSYLDIIDTILENDITITEPSTLDGTTLFTRALLSPQVAYRLKDNYQEEANQKFDLEQLKRIIQKNDIKTIEQFIASLPTEYKKYFTLVYASRSLHDATDLAPRIIFYGSNARLIIATAGNAEMSKGLSVEIIQFNNALKTFDFFDLRFDPKEINTPKLSDKNPSKCLSCHRKTDSPLAGPRPNWNPYFVWKGLYGSNDDSFYINREGFSKHTRPIEEERNALISFLNLDKAGTRYKTLPNITTRFSLKRVPTESKIRPNFELTSMLADLNAERIAQEIMNHIDYNKLKFAIASAFIGCEVNWKILDPHGKLYTKIQKAKDDYQRFQIEADSLRFIYNISNKLLPLYLLDQVFDLNLNDDNNMLKNWTMLVDIEDLPSIRVDTNFTGALKLNLLKSIYTFLMINDADLSILLREKDQVGCTDFYQKQAALNKAFY